MSQGTNRTVDDATCLGCGCLCDDIAVEVAGGRIVEARRACPIGCAWFLADHDAPGLPDATIEGRPVGIDEAIDRATDLLNGADAVALLGLTGATIEAQAAALALADRLGAVVAPAHLDDAAPRILAVQRVGRVSATLGEVRQRADVVVFWGVDPLTTHPRHAERYSIEPRGRFVPDGRAGRTVLVADVAPTPTAALADDFLAVEPANQFRTLWSLRALIGGVEVDPGPWFEPLRRWAERLRNARYAAFFYGPKLGRPPGGAANVEAMLTLVRDLNQHTRAVALPLGGAGNPAGIESVLTWQAAAPAGVDFGTGTPEALPAGTTAEALLARGGVDAALILADDVLAGLGPLARDHLQRIPTIVLAADATARPATVAIRTAAAGIDEGGTVARVDGVMLPLRPAFEARRPTLIDLLRRLEPRLKIRSGDTPR